MSRNMLRAFAVVATVAWMGVDPAAARAAEDKKKAEDRANQVEGTLAAVDLTRNKVRIVSVTEDPNTGQKSESDNTLPVADDARITLMGEGKTGASVVKLADLKYGMRVVVMLTADKKTVTEIRAAKKVNSRTIGVRSVDVDSRTVTTSIKDKTGIERDETYAVAADAPVTFAGHGKSPARPGKLADLRPGMSATLRLSEDEKSVVQIRVAAPTAQGVMKSVDAEKNTITITIGAKDQAKDQARDETYDLEKGATVVVDGKEAKLTDFKPGTRVQLLLSPRSAVVGVRAGEKKPGK